MRESNKLKTFLNQEQGWHDLVVLTYFRENLLCQKIPLFRPQKVHLYSFSRISENYGHIISRIPKNGEHMVALIFGIHEMPSSSLSTQCSHHVHEFPKMMATYRMWPFFLEICDFFPIGPQNTCIWGWITPYSRWQQRNSPSGDI